MAPPFAVLRKSAAYCQSAGSRVIRALLKYHVRFSIAQLLIRMLAANVEQDR